MNKAKQIILRYEVVDNLFIAFYGDYSYRYSHWKEGDFSLFKIRNGMIYVKHDEINNWIRVDNDDTFTSAALLADKMIKEHKEIEKILLGDNYGQ